MVVSGQFELHGAARSEAMGSDAAEVVAVLVKPARLRSHTDCSQNIGRPDASGGAVMLPVGPQWCAVRHTIEVVDQAGHRPDWVHPRIPRSVVVHSGVAIPVLLVGKADGNGVCREEICNRELLVQRCPGFPKRDVLLPEGHGLAWLGRWGVLPDSQQEEESHNDEVGDGPQAPERSAEERFRNEMYDRAREGQLRGRSRVL